MCCEDPRGILYWSKCALMMYYFALLASDCFQCFGIIEERLEDSSQFQSSSLYKRKHRLRIYKTNESYMLPITCEQSLFHKWKGHRWPDGFAVINKAQCDCFGLREALAGVHDLFWKRGHECNMPHAKREPGVFIPILHSSCKARRVVFGRGIRLSAVPSKYYMGGKPLCVLSSYA